MDNAEVRDWIDFAGKCCGIHSLNDLIDIKWSNRMTRAKGTACFYRFGKRHVIKLSRPLFARDDYDGNANTVIHEACHIIDGVLNGRMDGHGDRWRGYMVKCGQTPERCHSVDNTGLAKRWVYECPGCGHEFNVSTVLRNKIARGSRRVCKGCRTVFDHDAYKGPALQRAAQDGN